MKALSPLKKYKGKVLLAPLLKLFECITELAMPFLVRYIIDKGISKGDLNYAIGYSLILFSMAIFGFLFTLLAQYLASKVSALYGSDLRKELYDQLNRLSEKELNDFGKEKALTILSNDSFNMQNGVMMFMRLILRPPFLLIGSTIISFTIDIRTGFIFLLTLVGSSFIIFLVMVLSPKKYQAIQENLDDISLYSNDTLKGARVIRAFNKEEDAINDFQKLTTSYKNKSVKLAKLNALINPFTFFFVNLGMILVVYIGQINVSNGQLTTGEITSLISYLVSSLAALVMFSRLILSLNKATASNKRINSFFALKGVEVKEGKIIEDSNEIISFKDVTFSYSENAMPALKNINLTLHKGESIGFIGGTGSGKSTLISLIERIYEPTSGTIYYKGLPLKEYDIKALRREISLVNLKPSIFKGTIKSNLLVAKPNANEEEIVTALKDALAFEFVNKYNDFLNHPVLDNGSNFSGGQRQRLLLSRGLLKGGELLILDDATSALDYISEAKIRENIANKNLTSITISQRISSIRHADVIYVFDKGEIIASGSHDELLMSCPLYKEINDIQEGNR